jgi:DNA-directed RNA polymerase specialized sigma24 family protein
VPERKKRAAQAMAAMSSRKEKAAKAKAKRAANRLVHAAHALVPTWAGRGAELPPEQRDAIDHAVQRVGRSLEYDRKQDLRQEVTIALLTSDTTHLDDLKAWAVACAKNLLADYNRLEARRREILEGWHVLGIEPAYKCSVRRDPHMNYVEIQPFTSDESLTSGRLRSSRNMEDTLIEVIDERARLGTGTIRAPLGRQVRIAEKAIQKVQAARLLRYRSALPSTISFVSQSIRDVLLMRGRRF